MVICEVCLKPRSYKKYRRHLRLHSHQGEISFSEINSIIFQTKKSKNSRYYSGGCTLNGSVCSLSIDGKVCGSIVLNLRAHLVRTHGLLSTDELFTSIMETSNSCSKVSHYQNNDNIIMNPSLKFSNSKRIKMTNRLATNAFDLTTEVQTNIANATQDGTLLSLQCDSQNSTYTFDGEDNDSPDMADYLDHVKRSISRECYSAIESFSNFLPSVNGGSRTPRAVQMDRTNIFAIIHAVGEINIFSCDEMNKYISKEIKSGRAPSTSYSKIQSFSRFLDYIQYHNESLIPKTVNLDKYLSMLNGLKHSILKLRVKRNKLVMSKSRKMFEKTLEVMSKWTNSRNTIDISSIMCKYFEDTDLLLNKTDFELIRGYFILELVIPNGQRPGIIQGLVIEEVNSAENDIIDDVNRIVVTEHKTGAIQPAVIFVYHNVFLLLLQFIEFLLPKLLVFMSGDRVIDTKTNVFLTFDGEQILSSRVTPLFRKAMNSMGIRCDSNITDFRKASVSLTGKYCPEYHDIMSQFLCHSRNVHEKTYKINLGHSGLVNAFKALQRMQKQPFQSVHKVPSYKNLDNIHHTNPHHDQFSDSTCSSEVYPECEITIPQPQVSTPNNIVDLASVSHQSILFRAVSNSSIPDEFSDEVVDDGEPSQISENISDIDGTSPLNMHIDLPEGENDNISAIQMMKDCSISLVRHSLASFESMFPMPSVAPLTSFESATSVTPVVSPFDVPSPIAFSHHRSLFKSHKDENLFVLLFSKYIDRVSHKLPISKKQIISIANTDSRCSRLLEYLRERYPNDDIYHKLYMKVRTMGFYKRRQQWR